MPVGGATRTLAALAAYGADERVLDVGTGCGYHAILAALCGARVTATDVSARALDYARFNAALAGAEIDFRRGSLLEPVRDSRSDLADAVDSLDSWSAARERYDVVVSNPPFVITPEAARADGVRTYRDGGREGDSLLAELVGELGGVLAPGGRAWMLGNWEIKASDAAPDRSRGSALDGSRDAAPDRPFDAVPDWARGPAAWIPDGLDAWVIQREVLAPPDYAEMWLRDGGQTPRDRGYEGLRRLARGLRAQRRGRRRHGVHFHARAGGGRGRSRRGRLERGGFGEAPSVAALRRALRPCADRPARVRRGRLGSP